MLRVEALSKKYGKLTALDRIEYTFNAGLYGLLGENGAGKTTFMKLLCGLIAPDSGDIYLRGHRIGKDMPSYLSHIGYLPQKVGFFPDRTPLDFLRYMGAVKGLSPARIKEESARLIPLLNLEEVQNKRMKTLSGGNIQRVGIAQAMLGEPDILILDEPTVGLDPMERIRIRTLFSAYAEKHTVLLSTHIVSDLSDMAGDILILQRGKMITHGSAEALCRAFPGRVWTLTADTQTVQELQKHHCVSSMFSDAQKGCVRVRVVSDTKPHPQAEMCEPTLEEVYLYHCRSKNGDGVSATMIGRGER